MNRSLFVPALMALLIVVTAGCASGPRVYEVTGTVTLDGDALSEGYITFIPEDKEFGSEAAKVVDGKYTVKIKGGKQKVEIRATRVVPGKKDPMGTGGDVKENYIPERYNLKTELSAEVGEGKTEHSFPLKSK